MARAIHSLRFSRHCHCGEERIGQGGGSRITVLASAEAWKFIQGQWMFAAGSLAYDGNQEPLIIIASRSFHFFAHSVIRSFLKNSQDILHPLT